MTFGLVSVPGWSLNTRFFFTFLRAVFRAAPQLTERLEEAEVNITKKDKHRTAKGWPRPLKVAQHSFRAHFC